MKLKILGDWKGAREALKSVEKEARKVSNSIKGQFGKISGFFSKVFSPLGFGLSGLGITTVFTSVVNKLDEIGKAASRMGVSSEYFQKMKFAADRTGSSIDQVGEAFGKVVAQVGKLASGDENAKKIFDRMGLSKEDLAGLNNEQVFDKVNKAIAGIGDEQQRNAVKAQLYGESFLKLNNFLREYAQLGDEAKSRGLIIDDKTIKAAEGLKDAMTNAGTAFMAALAGSGAVKFLDRLAQERDAQNRMPQLQKETGTFTRQQAIDYAISEAEKSGNYTSGQIARMKKSSENYSRRAPFMSYRTASDIDKALRDVGWGNLARDENGNFSNATGANISGLKKFQDALKGASSEIGNLTAEENRYLGMSSTFEELETRKNKILTDRKAAAEAAAKAEEVAAAAKKDFDTSKAVAQSVLGKTSPTEQALLNEAETAEEVYAAIDKITDARDKENATIDEKIKKLNQELKYQRMIEEGKSREVEIEKALEQAAPGGDVSKLTPEQRQSIADAAGAMYDLRNPAKSAAIAPAAQIFPTDSLRRLGGMSGSFNGSNPSLNYQKSSSESLGTIKNMVNDINNKLATGNAGAMQAP